MPVKTTTMEIMVMVEEVTMAEAMTEEASKG
jgi:hypothetical protein